MRFLNTEHACVSNGCACSLPTYLRIAGRDFLPPCAPEFAIAQYGAGDKKGLRSWATEFPIARIATRNPGHSGTDFCAGFRLLSRTILLPTGSQSTGRNPKDPTPPR